MKKILSPEIQQLNDCQKLYDKQKNKSFNYTMNDFIIIPVDESKNQFKWKHTSWKTWLQGSHNIDATQALVQRYICECNKPYGERNLDFIHLF